MPINPQEALKQIEESLKNQSKKKEMQSSIGGMVTLDMSRVIEVTAEAVAAVISTFISQSILDRQSSYTQTDGTVAIAPFKVQELVMMTRYTYKQMPESMKSLHINFAKFILKEIIERIIENENDSQKQQGESSRADSQRSSEKDSIITDSYAEKSSSVGV